MFNSQLGKIKHARKFIITTNGNVREGPLDDLIQLCNDILKTGENDLGYFPFFVKSAQKSKLMILNILS